MINDLNKHGWAKKTLAFGDDEISMIVSVANMMNLGYIPDGDSFISPEGHHCQPMIWSETKCC